MIRFGVFTGDIVFKSNEHTWDSVDADLRLFHKPIYFAAGNHDITDRVLYEGRYGKTYYHFKQEKDLFIILDPNLAGWNITGDQLLYLQTTIAEEELRNVFVFVHQLLWWGTKPEYKEIVVNSINERSSQNNFWSEVAPIFEKTGQPVYIFAGDIGAFKWSKGTYYHEVGNIHLIASGMGSGVDDNILIVHVPRSDSVRIDVLPILKDSIVLIPLK